MKTIKSYTKKEINEIINYLKSGLTNVEISEILYKNSDRTITALYKKVLKTRKKISLNTKINKTRNFSFYSTEEINLIKRKLKEGYSIGNIANIISTKYNRSYGSAYTKTKKLQNESFSKVKTKTLENTHDNLDLGIELPEGMTFEGKAKKIILHSGYFKVYI